MIGHSRGLSGLKLRPGRVFYGWWLALAGATVLALNTAVFGTGFGAFFLHLARDLGTTRGVLSGAFAAMRMEGGLLGPLEGYLIDRLGPRRIMMVGYLLFGGGFIAISMVHSVVQFYAAFLVTALGASLSGFFAVTTVTINWFVRKRGQALALVMAGASLGGLLVPVVAWSIGRFGWRPTAVGIGIFLWLVGFPLASRMHHRPEDRGLLPDGAAAKAGTTAKVADAVAVQQRYVPAGSDLTPRQALRTSAFWLLAAAHGLGLTGWAAMSVHQIPALVDSGLSETVAATMVGLSMGATVVGRLMGGALGDRFGTKRVLLGAYLFQATGIIALAFASTIWHGAAFALLFGLGSGSRGTLLVSLRGALFGRRSYATISGMMEPLLSAGSITSPLFAGFLYDAQQSYRFALVVIAAVSLSGFLFLLGVRMPRRIAESARSVG